MISPAGTTTEIWEWTDIASDDRQVEILRDLASADESILRFAGMEYRQGVTLSSGDKQAIREVLLAYEVMLEDSE